MITVLRWLLLRRRMFMVWWTLGVSTLIGVTVLAYLSIEEQAQTFDQAFSDLSESAGSFLGGSDLFSPIGYLSSQIYYIILPLLLIIMILTLVSSLMSKDENDTTVELTLARPVSRTAMLTAKAVAAATIITVVGVISYLVTIATVAIADIEINQSHLLLTHGLTFAFAASFGAISFTLIAASKLTRKFAGIIAIIVSFGGYVITGLAAFVSELEGVAKAMPYYYFETADLLAGKIDSGLLLYLIGVLVIGSVVSVIGYNRRDIS